MREIKKYVRFYTQKRAGWEERGLQHQRNIFILFNYDGKRLCTLTGLKIAECDWDSVKQRVKLTVKRAKDVNAYLDGLEEKVNDIYFGALAKQRIPDNNYILKELSKDREKENPSLFGEWEKYLEVKKHNLKPKSHEAIKNSFDHFKKFAIGKRLDFDDINTDLVSKYAAHLFTLGHVDNTVHKHIKRMRSFMTYAKRQGLHTNERYKDFNVSAKVGRIFFLDWNEVKTLLDYKPENETERKVLDNFLFGCLTAMRFSDYHSLKRSDINTVNFDRAQKTYNAANIRQLKTDKVNEVPLLPEAMAIIERNKDAKGDYALPRMSNQKINQYIKAIGKKAGLTKEVPVDIYKRGKRETKHYQKWERLCTHTGRKSFVSMAVTKGIPINITAAITGQNVKTTLKHYMGVLDKEKYEELMSKMKF